MLPAAIPKAQIWTFNFELEWPNNVPIKILSYVGSKLLKHIEDNFKDQTRPILFIGHDIGGLIVMAALTYLARDGSLSRVVGLTAGILFLGTPFHGDGEWATLMRDFNKLARSQNLAIECFHEQPPRTHHRLLRLKDRFKKSARHNAMDQPQEIVQCLDGHHRVGLRTTTNEMNSFSSPRNENFRIISRHILQLVPKAPSATPTPVFTPIPVFTPPPSRRAPIFSVPYVQNPDFVGRENVLDEIKSRMKFKLGFQARLGLWGLGGIGKTQIAIRYAYSVRENFDDVSVFWIRAANRDRFEASYLDLAQQIGVEFTQDGAVDKLQLVVNHLRNWKCGRWLMIIDNADEIDHFISTSVPNDDGTIHMLGLAQYIPICDKGWVLITSRVKDVCVELAGPNSIIHVDKMEIKDCKVLLQTCPQDEHSEEAATNLIQVLEYLPLALRQAVAFMTIKSMAVSKYLDLFNQNEVTSRALLSDEIGADIKDGARNVVGKTWIISFNQIKGSDSTAVKLLSFMSFIDRQDISKSILPGGQNPTDLLFEKALGTLQSYSMVSAGSKDNSYDIHGLIQLCMRSWLTENGERDIGLRTVVNEFSKNFPDPVWQHWQECARYLPHIQAVSHYLPTIDEYDEERRKEIVANEPYTFDFVEGLDTRNEIDLFLEIARYLHTQGRYWEAEAFELRSWTMANAIFGPDDLLTIRGLSNLATTYTDQGRWQEAEHLQVEVLQKHQSILGEESPEALTCMMNLAESLSHLGRVEEAKAIGFPLLEKTRRVRGENTYHTFLVMGNLARACHSSGDWENSENLFEEALDALAELQGVQSPLTLACGSGLARLRVSQGKLTGAEEMMTNILETRRKIQGEYHEDTIYSLWDLMDITEKLGKLEEAEILSKEALEKSRKVFGESHENTLKIRKAFERLERPRSWWRDMPRQETRKSLEICNVADVERSSTGKQSASPTDIDVEDIYDDPAGNEISRGGTVHRYTCVSRV